MKNKVYLTIDTDWCTDEVLLSTVNFIISSNIPVTWFITNPSKIVNDVLVNNPLFDIGPHPNFLENSSHGKNEDEVMEYILKLVPGFKIYRNHACHYNGKIIKRMRSVGAMIDASLFLPGCLNISPIKQYVTEDEYILRVPYTWSDYYCLLSSMQFNPTSHIKLSEGDVVFCFHPVHLYYNTYSLAHYNHIRSNNGHLSLVNVEHKGIKDMFLEIIDYCKNNNIEIVLLSDYLGV